MRIFNTLALEITSHCNRACKFCPVAYNKRPIERMPGVILTKIVRELAELKYSGRVELYIYNEPLYDLEQLRKVVTMVRANVPRVCLMIATNGDYLRNGMLEQLFDLGLNQILVNCYSPGLYEKRLPWINGLPSSVSRTRSVYAKLPPTSRTVAMLDKSDVTKFGKGVFALSNRAGNIPDFLQQTPEPLNRMCVKPFRFFNINWQGNALVCCQDYHAKQRLGSVLDRTLLDLWNDPVLNAYRTHLLAKDRSLPLCRGCDCNAGAYPHNVPKVDGPAAPMCQVLAGFR